MPIRPLVVTVAGAAAMVSAAAPPLVDAALMLVAAFVGSSFGAWITARAARRQRRAEALDRDVRHVQDLLLKLRTGQRARAAAQPDAPSDFAMAELIDELQVAAERTLHIQVIEAVAHYLANRDFGATATLNKALQAAQRRAR